VGSIAEWLASLGLSEYVQLFVENGIDSSVLRDLTDQDLKDLGVLLGHRRKILRAIAQLDESAVAISPVVATHVPHDDADRRQLTVMFCDLVGSTALSKRLDPEDLRKILGAYYRGCADVITKAGGFIAQYLGDGVLAYFGYPQAHEDDAERAVRAGLTLVRAIGKLDSGIDENLRVRIGIATGVVVVGDITEDGEAREHGVVGETPNLAARLQTLAEAGAVMISSSTQRLTGGLFDYRDMGLATVKGFDDPVRVWQVLGPSGVESRSEALHATTLTPIVGRDEEIELLLRRWQQAKNGEGQVVLLSGEPGIGKSRLAAALEERLQFEPHARLRYFCSLRHQDSALYPFISHLERAAGLRSDDTEQRLDKLEAELALAADNLNEAAPLVAALLSIPTGGRYQALNLTPQKRREKTLSIIMEQIKGLAMRQPLLILFEDAQWVDPSSLEALDQLVDRTATLPVLLIITFRPEFTPPWIGRSEVTLLTLNRLPPRQRAEMIECVTVGKALPKEIQDQIIDHTDGIPLFVEELTKTVLESGLLREQDGRYVLDGPLPPLAIPMTLQASLMARLDRLVPVRDVAQIAAAIGRRFSYELISAVASMPRERLDDALDHLVSAELVFRRGAPPDAEYAFKHALVQDAAYNSMLRGPRRQLHSRIADAFMSHFEDLAMAQPETIARHLTDAERWADAGAHWLSAGQLALRRGAPREAIAQFIKGLAAVARMPESPARIRLELALQAALGPTLKVTKGPGDPEFGRVQAAAFELCCQLDDRPGLFSITFSLCLFYWAHGELSKANDLAVELLTTADASRTAEYMMNAEMLTSMIRLHRGDPLDARQRLERAVAAYDPALHQDLYPTYLLDVGVFGRFYLALACSALGDLEQAAVHARDALDLARVLHQPHSYGFALLANFITETWRGDWLKTHDFASECIAYSSEQGFPEFVALAQICRGWARLQRGDEKAGMLELDEGISNWQRTGFETWQTWYGALLAETMIKAGRPTEALVEVDRQLARIRENDEHLFESLLLAAKAGAVAELQPTATDVIEGLYGQALDLALYQKARSWELTIGRKYADWLAARGRTNVR
jgi:class 3 adenylate cyclase/tetratricopeptide (TPR) repeat protein